MSDPCFRDVVEIFEDILNRPEPGFWNAACRVLTVGALVALIVGTGAMFLILILAVVFLSLWFFSLFLAGGNVLGLLIFGVNLAVLKLSLYVIVVATSVAAVAELYRCARCETPTMSRLITTAVVSSAFIGASEVVCAAPSLILALNATPETAFVRTCAIYAINTAWGLVFGLVPAFYLWNTRVASAPDAAEVEVEAAEVEVEVEIE